MIPNVRLASLLVLVALFAMGRDAWAMMAGRVDGHTVYYSADQAYTVDDSLAYVGNCRSEITGGNVNDMHKTYSVPVQNEVFGRIDPATGKVVELFIAQWELWPVGLKEQGPLKQSTYDFRVPRFRGLDDFLKEKGIPFAELYYGGMMQGFAQAAIRTRYYFAIAVDVIPANVGKDAFLRDRFPKAVREKVK